MKNRAVLSVKQWFICSFRYHGGFQKQKINTRNFGLLARDLSYKGHNHSAGPAITRDLLRSMK
jgi:hypothetical protein